MFDVLATYAYAKARLDGANEDEAKQRGMIVAIMGAKTRLGHQSGGPQEDFQAEKAAAEKKNRTTITAESFDTQVAGKLGKFFVTDFLPILKTLAVAVLSYDEINALVLIPSAWGAKIRGTQFKKRAEEFLARKRH